MILSAFYTIHFHPSGNTKGDSTMSTFALLAHSLLWANRNTGIVRVFDCVHQLVGSLLIQLSLLDIGSIFCRRVCVLRSCVQIDMCKDY